MRGFCRRKDGVRQRRLRQANPSARSGTPAKCVDFAGEKMACGSGAFGRPTDERRLGTPAKGVAFGGEQIA